MEKNSQAGYSIKAWCAQVSIGKSTFYVLPAHLKPRTAKLGKRHLIIESPRDYLERIAAQNKVAA